MPQLGFVSSSPAAHHAGSTALARSKRSGIIARVAATGRPIGCAVQQRVYGDARGSDMCVIRSTDLYIATIDRAASTKRSRTTHANRGPRPGCEVCKRPPLPRASPLPMNPTVVTRTASRPACRAARVRSDQQSSEPCWRPQNRYSGAVPVARLSAGNNAQDVPTRRWLARLSTQCSTIKFREGRALLPLLFHRDR